MSVLLFNLVLVDVALYFGAALYLARYLSWRYPGYHRRDIVISVVLFALGLALTEVILFSGVGGQA